MLYCPRMRTIVSGRCSCVVEFAWRCVHADESLDGRDDVRDVVDSLDVVHWRQSLDVTMLKDRLAVKQKGKRQSAAVQRKINTSPRVQVTRPAANSNSFKH